MIDPSLHLPWTFVLVFQLKRLFFLDVWPVVIGFVTIFCYQIYGRVGAMAGRSKLLVFSLSSIASMSALFGWATIIRSAQTIPLYACGVGLASVVVSQIYAVNLARHRVLCIPWPKVIWRSDEAGIQNFQKAMAAAMVAKKSS